MSNSGDPTESTRPAAEEPGRALHRMAVELAAMSQNGLTYSSDRYDIARYERLRSMSADLMGLIGTPDAAEFRAALNAEAGHATPKVDVRGALFRDDRVLLVQEAGDGRWTLPGGWADALDSPSAAAEREFAEEAGLRVRARRLAAVHDGSVRNGHAGSPWHTYKLFFLVDRLDDSPPRAGLDGETVDVGFFALDELPALSTARCTADQLAILLAHHRDPALPTDFD
ncbi:NUDIX hydrolase [Actinopolymorpha singaporensis]|uniref:ADP-ribose pyrophosphatase YjhB, NUDIX family n=1 Tax=Actinopolymorpha singaporensis TaxID=117157 RepID=A0A1H1Q171_9ACTN|nr:NUDIX hydrolase N-terminal domain-containing protein [Actinopolymorpha singaporensis]SDS17222.1 ADP-ribose pyrophosphatase YjhB, NUDIX family [Actinopolymorpha singaporensis]